MALQAFPLDVERSCESRFGAEFQYIEPPGVVGVIDPHMVGNKIQNESHVRLEERITQKLEPLFSAELRIDRVVIDDVITMGAAGARLEKGRRIDVADTEGFEIRHQGRRIG